MPYISKKKRSVYEYTGPKKMGSMIKRGQTTYEIENMDYLDKLTKTEYAKFKSGPLRNRIKNKQYLKLPDLRKLAAELEIPGRSKMNKKKLIDAIEIHGTGLGALRGRSGISRKITKPKIMPKIPVNIRDRQLSTSTHRSVLVKAAKALKIKHAGVNKDILLANILKKRAELKEASKPRRWTRGQKPTTAPKNVFARLRSPPPPKKTANKKRKPVKKGNLKFKKINFLEDSIDRDRKIRFKKTYDQNKKPMTLLEFVEYNHDRELINNMLLNADLKYIPRTYKTPKAWANYINKNIDKIMKEFDRYYPEFNKFNKSTINIMEKKLMRIFGIPKKLAYILAVNYASEELDGLTYKQLNS